MNDGSNARAASAWALALAFAAVYIIWGSTYLGIRVAIETIPPFLMVGVRFFAAGAILFAWSLWRGDPLPRAVHWRSAAIIGALLLVSGNGLLAWGEKTIPSGVAALIVGTVPLWMVILEALRPSGDRPGKAVILGLALGTVGIAVLVGPGDLGKPLDGAGATAILVAALSWAAGSIYSRSAPLTSSTLQNVGMEMLAGGMLLGLVSVSLGESVEWAAVSARSLWALVYLSVVGGLVGYSAYLWLLKVSTPAKVATYAYVNPVVAVILGWAVAGEVVDRRVVLAGAAVLAAVILITTSRAAGKDGSGEIDAER